MNRSLLFTQFLLSTFCLVLPELLSASVQESERSLGEQKAADKFLTVGEVDSWILEAARDEILIVNVLTNEFDAILGLAEIDGGQETVLFSEDQEGSNSRFRYRVRRAGKYKIRIHGYQMKGGGNYRLEVQRFKSKRIEIDAAARLRTGDKGHANFFFAGKPGQWITLVGSHHYVIFDPDGESVSPDWRRNWLLTKQGEYLVHIKGSPESEIKLEIRSASIRQLNSGARETLEAKEGTLYNWEIKAQKGQFELITVSRKSNPQSRVFFAPSKYSPENQLTADTDQGPELQFLPAAGKGKSMTYAVVFGRTGKFVLQTQLNQRSKMEVSMRDPTIDLHSNSNSEAKLTIGGSDYYGFDATAGDLVKFRLRSGSFDTMLRLFDNTGRRVLENDDVLDSTDSEIEFLVRSSGYYRWQAASMGNGGGGKYSFDFVEIPKKKISVGEVVESVIQSECSEYWSLKGKPGQTVIVNVRPVSFYPSISLFKSNGRPLSPDQGNVWNEQFIPLEIPRNGNVLISVSATNRGGKYAIRVLDGGWEKRDQEVGH